MNPQDINSYGGHKVDLEPVEVPPGQRRADVQNIITVDTAALTLIPIRAWVRWVSVSVNGFISQANITHRSIWGNGDGQKPTVERTGTGLYTITYASEFFLGYTLTSPIGDEKEILSFVDARVSCSTSGVVDVLDDFSDSRKLTTSGSVATIVTKAGGAAADVGNNSGAAFEVSVLLF